MTTHEGDASGGEATAAAIALADELRSWLSSGTIQGPDGAFHAWHDLSDGELAFAYPEITGYALTWFASLSDMTQPERESGTRAAKWLMDRIEAGNLAARDGWDSDAIYNFDLGMISSGLISFGRVTGEREILASGSALADYLHRQIGSDGSIGSISPEGPQGEGRRGWSVDGEVHLLKVIQCLLLADEVGAVPIDEATEAFVDRMKSLQSPEGWFETQDEPGFVMLHPHHYAIEGLYMWGKARGDEDALGRARAATEWAWGHQLPTGGFPRAVAVDASTELDAESSREQWDATSQAIRAAQALDLDPPGLSAAVGRLDQGASRTDGEATALFYQPDAALHENAWATLFGAQAIAMSVPGAKPLAWDGLV